MSEPVTQEDQFGCGVACTAFLLGKNYQETKNLFDKKKIEEYGCDSPDISKVLNKNGQKYKWKKYSGGDISDKSLVYIGKSDFYKVGHWVVKIGDSWMNPWIEGETLEEAKGGFQRELPRNNIEYIVYPEEV